MRLLVAMLRMAVRPIPDTPSSRYVLLVFFAFSLSLPWFHAELRIGRDLPLAVRKLGPPPEMDILRGDRRDAAAAIRIHLYHILCECSQFHGSIAGKG